MTPREQRALEIADDAWTGIDELDPYDQLERIATAILRAMDEERERALGIIAEFAQLNPGRELDPDSLIRALKQEGTE